MKPFHTLAPTLMAVPVIALGDTQPRPPANAAVEPPSPSHPAEALSHLSFADPVARVAPAVATVLQLCWFDDETQRSFEALDADERKWLLDQGKVIQVGSRLGSPMSHGSGFVIDADGHLVTNHHVIESDEDEPPAFAVSVGTDGDWQEATLKGTDPSTDLAVLKVPEKNPTIAEWEDVSTLRVGDIVLAIGTPRELELRQTVTMGVVSGLGRAKNGLIYEDFIQTDASLNGGNSGGPLISVRGRVVGVNQSILLGMVTDTSGEAVSNAWGQGFLRTEGNIGVGFAISARLAKRVVEELIAHGRVRRGFLGLRSSPATARLGDSKEALTMAGLRVDSILPDSPAEKAGARINDVLIAFNDSPLTDNRQFHLAVSLTPPGTPCRLVAIRQGARVELTPTLADLAATRYRHIGFLPGQLELPNVEGVVFTVLRAPDGQPAGVGITRVDPQSEAARAGLSAPSLILQIAGVPIESIEQFAAVAATSVAQGHLLIAIRDRKGEREVSVPVEPAPTSRQ